MSQFDELSEGWYLEEIQNLCDFGPKHSKELSDDLEISFVPMPAVDDVTGTIQEPEIRRLGEVKKGYTHFANGDVIFAKITPCMENGKAAVAADLINGIACGSTEFHVLRSNGSVLPDYVYRYLRQQSYRDNASQAMTGAVGQRRVPKQFLLETKLPLPPLNEQRRIVEKIEALTARSRKARAALDEIPTLLDQFRQSVLAAAFRGDLTADWRAQNPDVEPAEALIERVRVGRRDRWEEAELEKMRAKGKLPKDSKWREKYKNPIAPQPEKLRQLPETWAWATLDQIMEKIVDGTHHTPTYIESGIPFLSVKDIRDGKLYFDNCKYISEEEHACLIERCHPQVNDLLITKSGTIGRCAVVRTENPFSLFVSVALLKPVSTEILTDFVSVIFQAWLQTINIQNDVTGSAIKNFHIIDFRKLSLPIPPIEEQKEIIRKVQIFQACIESIKLQYQEIEDTVDHLDQSILAKAFRGELVPQDPNDEPAAVLLDRIRAERERLGGGKKRGKAKA